jgi:hypothetical protein
MSGSCGHYWWKSESSSTPRRRVGITTAPPSSWPVTCVHSWDRNQHRCGLAFRIRRYHDRGSPPDGRVRRCVPLPAHAPERHARSRRRSDRSAPQIAGTRHGNDLRDQPARNVQPTPQLSIRRWAIRSHPGGSGAVDTRMVGEVLPPRWRRKCLTNRGSGNRLSLVAADGGSPKGVQTSAAWSGLRSRPPGLPYPSPSARGDARIEHLLGPYASPATVPTNNDLFRGGGWFRGGRRGCSQ